jgi:dienelactone hydrolase
MRRTLEWSAPDGGARRGLLELASDAGPRPAALIAHDDAGAFAELLARALVAAGWGALRVPAAGLGAARADRARTAELEAALGALAQDPQVQPELVAIVGIGALGAQAFLCACASRRAAAVVVVCGALVHAALDAEHPVQPLDMLLNLSAPALIVHAEEDERCGTAQASSAVARIERALRSAERVAVPGPAAGFLDPTSAGYHAGRAERAAASIAAFLRALSDEP